MSRNLLLLAILFLAARVACQNLILDISGIRCAEGSIQLMFYKTAASFEDDAPWLIRRHDKADMHDGQMVVYDTIPPGIYGVVLLDDENDSENMEYNFFGLPKEGFGFAGYDHRGVRRPKFQQFCFDLDQGSQRKKIRVKYF